jgi:four helix bundle protein
VSRFDQLDVYRTAIEYVGSTRALVLRLRRNDPVMADQLHRAVLSIPLNTAEGAGDFSPGDKCKFYRYALRSTAESVAVLDVSREVGLMNGEEHATCRELGMRLMAMLTRLVIVSQDRERESKRNRRRDEEPESPVTG